MTFKTEFLTSCGILSKWHDSKFSDFVNDPDALKVITNYLENPARPIKDGVGLFLYGANGVGKTLLMNCAFKELLNKRHQVRIISLTDLITLYTSSWYNEEDKSTLDSIVRRTRFLGIEEIGKEFRSNNTDLGVTVLDHVLRIRLQNKLPVWFTSNKEPKDLKDLYTEDIASMLREACLPLLVKGQDYRNVKKEQLKKKYL